jgi:hypothetical protein
MDNIHERPMVPNRVPCWSRTARAGEAHMTINKEFLAKLDREIASLKERRLRTTTDDNAVAEIETQLRRLEELRQHTVTQSTGG